jgi:hypothetical protein
VSEKGCCSIHLFIYNQMSVDLAVDNLNAVVNEAIAEAISISNSRTNTFPHW